VHADMTARCFVPRVDHATPCESTAIASSCPHDSVPVMAVKTDWLLDLDTCVACNPAGSSLVIVDGDDINTVNTLVAHSFNVNGVTVSATKRIGNKEYEYCSRRGRCNQENGVCSWCGPSLVCRHAHNTRLLCLTTVCIDMTTHRLRSVRVLHRVLLLQRLQPGWRPW
jgi:hypothetical protein